MSPLQAFGGTDAEGEGRKCREAEEDIQKIQHDKAPDVAGSKRAASARKRAIREATGSRKARVKTARRPGFMFSGQHARCPRAPGPGSASDVMAKAPVGTEARDGPGRCAGWQGGSFFCPCFNQDMPEGARSDGRRRAGSRK